ncbi:IclR family transcriptional regulator [Gayadomonas joobiniege]|uniref:IclR family transcriptional regulator n=1 Tax=Gayadomonas joobiniege TaxID=1234606 RepID=UPI00037C8822|nr:IclR family transcriptional regulator C-terminal domain-containing protein [Gayadomonas joobiniege]
MTDKSKVQLNQSLIDGIATLQELALSEDPVGCRELARRLGMEPTRVNRLLQTLDHIGIARKTAKRKYTPGPGMHVLSTQAMFASGLLKSVIKPLESLRKYGLTVAMGMLWRDHVSYLYHADPGMDATEALGRVGIYPATKGGVGMALLAEQSDQAVSRLYQDKEIEGYASSSELLKQLEEIREQGYAYVQTAEEHYTLAVAVGQPAFCAIAFSGWIAPSMVDELVNPLREIAEVINQIPH